MAFLLMHLSPMLLFSHVCFKMLPNNDCCPWLSSFLFLGVNLPCSSSFLCVVGFHRNEDMKAIDVLPILKEKVAFLSGGTERYKLCMNNLNKLL